MASLYICITLHSKDCKYFLSHYFTWDDVQTIHHTSHITIPVLLPDFLYLKEVDMGSEPQLPFDLGKHSHNSPRLLTRLWFSQEIIIWYMLSHNTFIKCSVMKHLILKSQHISEKCCACPKVYMLWINFAIQPSIFSRLILFCKLLGLQVKVFLRMFIGKRPQCGWPSILCNLILNG